MLDDRVLETNELELGRPGLVAGNIESVNVGVGAESSQLEIHLLGMLAGAEHSVCLGRLSQHAYSR